MISAIYAKATVLIEVKIFQDWTFVVFDILSRFCLCKGFPVVAKCTAKDARDNTVGTTEERRSHDDITVALYVRSIQCHVLLLEYTRPVNHYP